MRRLVMVVVAMVSAVGLMSACAGAGGAVDSQSQVLQLEEEGGFAVRVDVPAGWDQLQLSSSVELSPGQESDLDNATTMNIGTACAGLCVAQDWSALLAENPDRVRPRTPDTAELVTSEELRDPEGFVMVFDVDELFFADRHIIVARWDDDATRYLECFVGLGGGDIELTDQFVEICSSAEPDWFGAGS